MKPATRKRTDLLTGLALVVLLAGGLWHVRDHIRFLWRFESLGTNAQGYPEFRHRETGIVMVRLPVIVPPFPSTPLQAKILPWTWDARS